MAPLPIDWTGRTGGRHAAIADARGIKSGSNGGGIPITLKAYLSYSDKGARKHCEGVEVVAATTSVADN